MFDLASYSNGLGLVMLGFIVGLVIGFIFKVIGKIGHLIVFIAILLPGISSAAIVNHYLITGGSYLASPNTWSFLGSNDSIGWVILDAHSGLILANSSLNSYTFNNTTDYRYYKFQVTSSNSQQYFNFRDLSFYNNATQLSACMTSYASPTPNVVSSSSEWSTSQGVVQAFDCGTSEYVSGSGQLSGWLIYDFGVGGAANTATATLQRVDVEQGISLFVGALTAIAFVMSFALVRYT